VKDKLASLTVTNGRYAVIREMKEWIIVSIRSLLRRTDDSGVRAARRQAVSHLITKPTPHRTDSILGASSQSSLEVLLRSKAYRVSQSLLDKNHRN